MITEEFKNQNLAEWASANNLLGEIYYSRMGLHALHYKEERIYLKKIAIPEVKM